ncbi:hypothetical protein GC174_08775 [bacterium]|nr:hypothetical protein [bacterium]
MEVEEDYGLYSNQFWREVRTELQKEVQPKVNALLAGGYSYPVTGDNYSARHSSDDAEYNKLRSDAFWAKVAQRKETIDFYKYKAPPGDREFALRAVLEENTRASYRSATQIAHILAPMAEGHSSNKSINRETTQGEIEDNIAVAENDPRTAEALQHLKRANEELKQARSQFVSGNYQSGQEHLNNGKAELTRANEATNRLKALVEAAIAAGNLIARVASKSRSTFIPPVATNAPNSNYPPVAPPIVRRSTIANVVPPNNNQQAGPPLTGYENLDRKLSEYAEDLRQEARRQQPNPYLQARVVQNVDDKFTGIRLGLSEALDNIRDGAAKAFMTVANKRAQFDRDPAGTANSTLIASVEFGTRFANETMKAVDAASNDAAFFDKIFKESVVTASHEYSQKTPLEQGKVIGNFIVWDKLFSGASKLDSVSGNAFNRAKEALTPHAQKIQQTVRQVATASKSTVGAAKQQLNQLAANLGGQRQMIPAGAGGYGNVAYKPPESFYSVQQPGSAGGSKLPGHSGSGGSVGLSSGIKTGTGFGNVIVDDSPIARGILKGQRPSQGLKWPAEWRKPKKGDFFSSNGKLYFKPDEQFRK